MKLRLAALVMAFAVLGTFVLAPISASAAKPTTSIAAVPVSGTGTFAPGTVVNGTDLSGTAGSFVGTLTVDRFTTLNGQLAAVVTVAGTVTSNLLGSLGSTAQTLTVPATAAGSCTILDLTLGPLHLNLLGLVVDLNQVHLTITAQQGPGNLLGNLLCAVANLLNGGLNVGTALNQLVNLLNQLLGAL
jgi:hypothetical protein